MVEQHYYFVKYHNIIRTMQHNTMTKTAKYHCVCIEEGGSG